MGREKIYVDVDDVIINTSEVVINLLNDTYNITPPKTFKDLKDWGYKSIYRHLDKKILYQYWETDEFFNKVKINSDFLKFYNDTKNVFEWILFTHGTEKNLKKKQEFFSKYIPDIKINGVDISKNKNEVDLSDGIQIDDNYNNLLSNAYFKILIKNFHEANYNQVLENHTNLYVVNDWKEISQILKFYNSIDVKDLI